MLVFLQVKDYPGLLRVITWVINGLDLLVETAKCELQPIVISLLVKLVACMCLATQ